MSSCSSINRKKMNSTTKKTIPAQERRVGHCKNGDWNCSEWEKYRHQIFAADVGCAGDASLLFCASPPTPPPRWCSPRKGTWWTWPDQGACLPRWREVIYTAEKGMNGTAGAQEDVGMGKSGGRGTKEGRGMFRVTTEACCNKHWKNDWIQGDGPIFLI